MGLAIRKGTQNYTGIIFSAAHKLAWCISKCGWKISRPALIQELSTSNVVKCYVSYLFSGLTVSVVEPSREFFCLKKHL